MVPYIKIATLDNQVEAHLVEAILNKKHIPHTLNSYYDSAYNGLFQTQRGWGDISAPPDYKSRILEIIRDIRKSPGCSDSAKESWNNHHRNQGEPR
ncbi:MAG: hypothetical protein ACOC7U_09585 [Spirochaetota bacterium]